MKQDDDLYGLLHLQGRARDVLARAARMQDLHAQAQAQALQATPAPLAGAGGPLQPQQHLSQHAAQAVVQTHGRLQQAAHLAQQMAKADPVMARLNARINGAAAAAAPADVLDLDLTEVPESAAAPVTPHPAENSANPQTQPPRLPTPAAG